MATEKVRDFTLEAYESFKDSIVKNRDEMLDGFLLQNHNISQDTFCLARSYADIEHLESEIERYQSTVVQAHHDSLFELQTVFHDVYQVEQDAVALFKTSQDNYRSLVMELEAICSLIRPVDGTIKLFSMPLNELRAYLLANSFNSEKPYDLLLQQKVFDLLCDPRFSEEVWKTLDKKEREALLNLFLAEVQMIMGTSADPSIVFSRENHPDGYFALFQGELNTITLYPTLMENYTRDFILRTILQEVRHAYQAEVVMDWYIAEWLNTGRQGDKNFQFGENGRLITVNSEQGYEPRHPYVSEQTAAIWVENYKKPVPSKPGLPGATSTDASVQYRLYLEQAIEFDAWSFAGQLTHGVFPGSKKTLYSLNPAYQGSWDVPKKP